VSTQTSAWASWSTMMVWVPGVASPSASALKASSVVVLMARNSSISSSSSRVLLRSSSRSLSSTVASMISLKSVPLPRPEKVMAPEVEMDV